jgi:ribonuclease P protein component
MLPKKNRFTAKELNSLWTPKQKSKKHNTQYGFFVVYEESTSPNPSRIFDLSLQRRVEEGGKKGIILSKKNFKTAVLRNKYKRLFHSFFSLYSLT